MRYEVALILSIRGSTLAVLADWLKEPKEQQIDLIDKIRSIFKGIRIYFFPVMPRRWWGHHARKMAILENRNMIREPNTHILNLSDLSNHKDLNTDMVVWHDDDIHCGLLDWVRAHLNDLGYRIITRKCDVSLSIHNYEGAMLRQASHVQLRTQKISRRHHHTIAKRKKNGNL